MRLPVLSAAFVIGVLIGLGSGVDPWAVALFLLAGAFLVPLAVSLRWRILPVLAVPFLFAGMLRASIDDADAARSLDQFHGRRDLVVEGVVTGDPSSAGRATSLRLAVERVRAGGEGADWVEANGDVLVLVSETTDIARTREKPFFRYGDRLALTGTLTPPQQFDESDYPAFLERQRIGTVMTFPHPALLDEGEGAAFYRGLYSIRHRLSASLGRAVPEPQASFTQAVLLGIRDNLPDELVVDFRRSGTSHLLAISGLHVGVLLGISLSISAAAVGRRRQLYLIGPLIVIAGYTLIAGAPPSAIRAAIMGVAYLGALAVGRPRSVLPSLALAASVMVAAEPRLLSDVSFQLSFAAMTGIALLSTSLAERATAVLSLTPDREGVGPALSRLLIEAMAVTISATAATLPLVAFHFQQVSLVGLPSTLLTMPALPFALVTGAVAGTIGLAAGWAAAPFGWLAWAASAYITGVASAVGSIPGALVETGRLAPFLVWAYYAVLASVVFRRQIRRQAIKSWSLIRAWEQAWADRSRSVPWPLVALTFATAWLLWTFAVTLPAGELRVVFADVGQGDMTIIDTPRGHRIVVDGGPSPAKAAQAASSVLPFWARSIDLEQLISRNL